MTSFTAIPLSDIHLFLSSNNIHISQNTNENYVSAWNLIQNGQGREAPLSIVDWLIAYNLSNQQVKLPVISLLSIINAQPDDPNLTNLANILTLNDVNKERIISILHYLNVLDTEMLVYDKIPDDLLGIILSEMDCNTLNLMCNTSPRLNKYCRSASFGNMLHQKMKINFNQYEPDTWMKICMIVESKYHNKIVAGFDSSFVITANTRHGNAYGFGSNGFGKLGIGKNTDRMAMNDTNIPVQIPLTVNEIPDRGILFTNVNNIIQIAAGSAHSLALTSNGHVYSFGNNQYGQLGLENNINYDIPTLINNLNNIIFISAGSYHSLALDSSGRVYAFGYNIYGQLGLGKLNMGKLNMKDDPLNILGNNINVPTLIPDLNNIIQVSAGNNHSLALTSDGEVYSFGNNNHGQLGQGDNINRTNPVLIPGLINVESISAGNTHSMIFVNRKVYCFGSNEHGELGIGSHRSLNRIITPIMLNYLV